MARKTIEKDGRKKTVWITEFNPQMTPDDFEEANTEYYQQQWVESNPEKGYMINDFDIDSYVNDIDWGGILDDMAYAYRDWLEENY